MKLTKIESSIEINKPVRDVFAYASDWRHWKEWRIGATDIKPISEKEMGNNTRFKYEARVAGMIFNLETEIHNFKDNVGWQGIVRKGVPHKMRWSFENKIRSTIVTYKIEFSTAWFIIGPLLDSFILKPNWQRMIEKTLSNLKNHMEGSMEKESQQSI
jgi:uncharacterized membrane protein